MRSIRTITIVVIIFFFFSCRKNEENTFSASGIIEGTAIKVAAQTGGQILEMMFEEGESVAAGQTIAVVDIEKLSFQLEQLEAGLAENEIQKQINLNTLQKAQADFANINKKHKRYQELYEKNSASQQTLDDLKTAYETASTQLQNVKQNIRLLETRKDGLSSQKKLLRRQMDDAIVKSPISGILATKYFETGETIAPGFAIVEVIELAKVWTKVYISELLLHKIKTGDDVEIDIDGSPKKMTGKISWISPKAEFTPKSILTDETRTSLVYAVKVIIENPEGLLKHGMPVKIVLNVDRS